MMTAPMSKRVFVSYNHQQEAWVWDRLEPILRAGGAEVLIDRKRFRAGRGVIGQMDATQDQAEVSVLVMTPDYLDSDYCRHEMNRALAADGGQHSGKVLPVLRERCDLSVLRRNHDAPLHVDLRNDGKSEPWALLLKSLEADALHADAPHWLDVRDTLARKLGEERQSLNLVVDKAANWRALVAHLQQGRLSRLAVVDLDEPAAPKLDGLVEKILRACGIRSSVPRGHGLRALDALKAAKPPHLLAFTHFDAVGGKERRKAYGADLFRVLRYLIADERCLVLLAVSHTPVTELLPVRGEDSHLAALLQVVKLQGKSA
jgi:hypothetical protein